MADVVTSQKLVDGARNAVFSFTSVSDGTGEAAVLKVDMATLLNTPASVRIDKIQYDCNAMAVQVLWDATADVVAAVLGPGQGVLDFSGVGGLQNNAGAGKTGNILFTTVGATLNDTYTIVLHMKKS